MDVPRVQVLICGREKDVGEDSQHWLSRGWRCHSNLVNLTGLLNVCHSRVPASQRSEYIEQCLVNIVTVMMASVTEAYSRKAPEQRWELKSGGWGACPKTHSLVSTLLSYLHSAAVQLAQTDSLTLLTPWHGWPVSALAVRMRGPECSTQELRATGQDKQVWARVRGHELRAAQRWVGSRSDFMKTHIRWYPLAKTLLELRPYRSASPCLHLWLCPSPLSPQPRSTSFFSWDSSSLFSPQGLCIWHFLCLTHSSPWIFMSGSFSFLSQLS